MKALSVKQPWSGLIRAGLKTIELRKRPTHYRGELLICSSARPSQTDDAKRARHEYPLGETPGHLDLLGVAVCIVRVVDCRPATAADVDAACCAPAEGEWAWVLEFVRDVEPFAVKGSLSFYNVELP